MYAGPDAFRAFVPPQPKSGIPALDDDYKSSGFSNWNSSIFVPVGELYGADARWTLRHRPRVYVDAVLGNVNRYFLPGDQTYPFDTTDPTATTASQNRLSLQPLLTLWNRLLSWQCAPNGTAAAHVIGFPLLLALVIVLRGFRRDRFLADSHPRSDELTLTFALYSTLWVSAVTLLLSYDDHNRYRFEVSAFYCLFLALAVERVLTAVTNRRFLRSEPSPR